MRGLLRLLATALGLALAAPAAQAAGGLAATNSFLPATLTVKQSSRLRVTFVNNEAFAATGAALTNVLPDTVFVAASPGIATTCAGASVSTANTAQRGSVTITGATIPARSGTVAGSCTVDVTVFAARRGSYTNTLAAGALSATQDGQLVSSDQAASATLFATVLSLTGSMGGLTDVQGNEQVSRTIVLTNPNPVSMTGTAFTMNMSANGNHLAIFGQPTGNTCGGSAVVTSTPNTDAVFGPTSILTLTNGTVPASGSCTIFFRFQPSRDPALSYYDPQRVADIPANTVTTNEGATNALIFASVRAVTGVRVTPLFNGLATASVAPDTEA